MTITAEPRFETKIPEVTSAFGDLLRLFPESPEAEGGDVDLDPRPNATLAYEILDLIKANPGHLDMNDWVKSRRREVITLATVTECGTTACFAGWTVLAAGDALDVYWSRAFSRSGLRPGHRMISDRAQELLGLTDEDARDLFLETDDADLELRICEIFGPDPRRVAA